MDSIVRLVRREPVRVYTVLTLVLAFAVSLGLDLSAEQQVILGGIFAALLGIGGEAVRNRVSPVDRD